MRRLFLFVCGLLFYPIVLSAQDFKTVNENYIDSLRYTLEHIRDNKLQLQAVKGFYTIRVEYSKPINQASEQKFKYELLSDQNRIELTNDKMSLYGDKYKLVAIIHPKKQIFIRNTVNQANDPFITAYNDFFQPKLLKE